MLPVEEAGLAAPGHLAETNVFVAEVLREVGALPEAQRLAVLLVYVEGYSYRECAEMEGVPIGTIMSRLSAARSRLGRLQGDATGGLE